MKLPTLIITALVFAFAVPGIRAEDHTMKCEMCGAMKKTAAAGDSQKLPAELKAQAEEIDKLVTAMNGSIGKDKLEAMAAVITRLADQCKALSERIATAPAPAAREEAHQH